MSSTLSDYTISVLYNHAVERGWKKTAKAILKETGKDADSLKEKLDLSEIFKAQLQAAQRRRRLPKQRRTAPATPAPATPAPAIATVRMRKRRRLRPRLPNLRQRPADQLTHPTTRTRRATRTLKMIRLWREAQALQQLRCSSSCCKEGQRAVEEPKESDDSSSSDSAADSASSDSDSADDEDDLPS